MNQVSRYCTESQEQVLGNTYQLVDMTDKDFHKCFRGNPEQARELVVAWPTGLRQSYYKDKF